MRRNPLTEIAQNIAPLAFALATALATSSAYAVPSNLELQLSEPTFPTATVVGTPSSVVYAGSFGTFSVSIDAGIGTPVPQIDLGSTDISSSTAGVLTVMLSQTGLVSPAGMTQWLTMFSGNTSDPGSMVSLSSAVDLTDTIFGTGMPLSTLSTASSLFALSDTAGCGHLHDAIRVDFSHDDQLGRSGHFQRGWIRATGSRAGFADLARRCPRRAGLARPASRQPSLKRGRFRGRASWALFEL
jgi:hypothetical protein